MILIDDTEIQFSFIKRAESKETNQGLREVLLT